MPYLSRPAPFLVNNRQDRFLAKVACAGLIDLLLRSRLLHQEQQDCQTLHTYFHFTSTLTGTPLLASV
jgi:hypothetical protein